MSSLQGLTEEKIREVRLALSARIGEQRLSHTLGVEASVVELGELYLPKELPRLRIAALLHDLTKEWSEERQIDYLRSQKLPISPEEAAAPRILHARTAAIVAGREFESYVDPGILRAIALHTTGDAGMSVFDELLYLSDYIEPTRTYEDCVALRSYFHAGYATAEDKVAHLHQTVLRALFMSVEEVRARGGSVFPGTLRAISHFQEILSLK